MTSAMLLAGLEALAVAIGARDGVSPAHVPNIRRHASALARALGVSEQDMQALDLAAILHDAGKMAVPDHVLSKPGPLSPDEFARVRVHSAAGADILQGVPGFEAVASIVRSHHERWDGKGYPAGLTGAAIPLGARILTVVDYFDALTTERPWHTALGHAAAVELMGREDGRAFDPRVVRTFLSILPGQVRDGRDGRDGKDARQAGRAWVLSQVAAAGRETHGLYEMAAAMVTTLGVADLMAAVSAKLSPLVPSDACALFLREEERGQLACRFAAGRDAELMRQVRLADGEGLVGWVAANRRALVNARPSADLEAAGLPVATDLESALASPLFAGDRVVGVVVVYHERAACYTDEHRRLLDTVAGLLGPAVSHSILFEQTQEDALTDTLTGLPNARFLFMHLTRELARAERLGAQVGVLVMDLDGFKAIRKRYGRPAADRVLVEAARVLRAGLQPYDICVRYENDTFILVLSGCGPGDAQREARALQAAVDTVWLEVGKDLVPIAGSIGAAVYPDDGESFEAVLAKADARLRENKKERLKAEG